MSQIELGVEKLKKSYSGTLLENESLSRFATFEIGGPARILAIPTDIFELRKILEVIREFSLNFFILGKGSNILISDQGFQGLVIKLGEGFQKVAAFQNEIVAGAGVLMSRIIASALSNNLRGLAFAVGIPASLGGAIMTNAGAFDKKMEDILDSINMCMMDGTTCDVKKAKIEFGYRMTKLPFEGIITNAVLRLEKSDPSSIGAELAQYKSARDSQQPKGKSAGSIFKNPEDMFAGKLIEEAGCKGLRQGNAQISEIHANFIINLGQATANDVYKLMRTVQEKVLENSGVKLEPEIKLIGDFGPY